MFSSAAVRVNLVVLGLTSVTAIISGGGGGGCLHYWSWWLILVACSSMSQHLCTSTRIYCFLGSWGSLGHWYLHASPRYLHDSPGYLQDSFCYLQVAPQYLQCCQWFVRILPSIWDLHYIHRYLHRYLHLWLSPRLAPWGAHRLEICLWLGFAPSLWGWHLRLWLRVHLCRCFCPCLWLLVGIGLCSRRTWVRWGFPFQSFYGPHWWVANHPVHPVPRVLLLFRPRFSPHPL